VRQRRTYICLVPVAFDIYLDDGERTIALRKRLRGPVPRIGDQVFAADGVLAKVTAVLWAADLADALITLTWDAPEVVGDLDATAALLRQHGWSEGA
jgi:hypothetical protein